MAGSVVWRCKKISTRKALQKDLKSIGNRLGVLASVAEKNMKSYATSADPAHKRHADDWEKIFKSLADALGSADDATRRLERLY